MKYLKIMISIALFAGLVMGVTAQPIQSLHQTVDIADNGSAVITFQISFVSEDSTTNLKIPMEYEDVEILSIKLDDNDVTSLGRITLDRTSPVLEMNLRSAMVGVHELSVEAELPQLLDWDQAGPEEFKTYNWEVFYTNTVPSTITDCSMTVILPEGWNYHRITGSEPKFKKKEPKPPYMFAQKGDRASVTIRRSPTEYMDSIGIEFAFKKEQKPKLLIWIGLLLSAAYLYYFRHLITVKNVEQTIDTINDKESK